MIKKYNFLIFTVIFFLAFAAVFCTGYLRKDVSAGSGKFKIELPVSQGCCGPPPVEFNIQNEGPKTQLLQTEIVNKGNKPFWLSAKVTGIDRSAKVVLSHQSLDAKTGRFTKPLMPGQTLEVGVNLEIPQEIKKNNLTAHGTIEFADYKSGKMLGAIPLKVVYCSQMNDCNSACDSGNSCEGD